ncbi:hypothetical protein KAR91_47615 [Candidatus Pacearchaeota archaeon]|nr:hypothetical protein [Candidatus Pacearchaeota archaeon]
MPDKTEGTDARDQPKAVDLYLHTMAKNSEDIKYLNEQLDQLMIEFVQFRKVTMAFQQTVIESWRKKKSRWKFWQR